MIVQTAERPGGPAFVILQNDHTAFAGELARHFGNDRFARLEPEDLMNDLVLWHDEGWTELDSRFLPDPDSGLPRHLARIPINELLRTSELTPQFGEARHPMIGLLSSMHSCGLYNGRYGLDSFSMLDRVPAEVRAPVDAMIAAEEQRQERLKAELRSDPATAPLADDALVLRNYKALQFFDRFSLYLQCEHPSRHAETTINHVPVDLEPEHDVTITITPLGDARYRLDPFPFDVDPFEPATVGRYLDPQPDGADLSATWGAAEPAMQRVHLVS